MWLEGRALGEEPGGLFAAVRALLADAGDATARRARVEHALGSDGQPTVLDRPCPYCRGPPTAHPEREPGRRDCCMRYGEQLHRACAAERAGPPGMGGGRVARVVRGSGGRKAVAGGGAGPEPPGPAASSSTRPRFRHLGLNESSRESGQLRATFDIASRQLGPNPHHLSNCEETHKRPFQLGFPDTALLTSFRGAKKGHTQPFTSYSGGMGWPLHVSTRQTRVAHRKKGDPRGS